MRFSYILPVAVVLCALAACSRMNPIGSSNLAAADRSLSRQILVTMQQTAGTALSYTGDPGAFYLRRRGYGPSPGVDRMLDEIASDYALRRIEGWYVASIGEYCEVYELRSGETVADVIARMANDPRVSLVQAMNLFGTEALVYDDPYASMQPALTTLSIDAAHEFATGEGVTIAVVDSSIDRRHHELRGSIRSERDLVDRGRRRGAEVHGTAVAGVIGSAANNGEGIVGVAPDARIESLRACWTVDETSGRAMCSSFSVARALESAIEIEADIINLSLSGPDDALLAKLIDAAVAYGTIVVAATPAQPDPDNDFPSSYPGVIAAASSDAGPIRDTPNRLLAPGTEIISTTPNDGYAFFSGNSMSAAYVSGVSALVRQHRPDIDSLAMIRLLSDTANERSVNACRALAGTSEHDACP